MTKPADGVAAPVWIGTTEACQQLGIYLRTLYRLINDEELVAYKMGRVIRIRQTDVDDFLERARTKPGDLDHLTRDADDETEPDESDSTDPGS